MVEAWNHIAPVVERGAGTGSYARATSSAAADTWLRRPRSRTRANAQRSRARRAPACRPALRGQAHRAPREEEVRRRARSCRRRRGRRRCSPCPVKRRRPRDRCLAGQPSVRATSSSTSSAASSSPSRALRNSPASSSVKRRSSARSSTSSPWAAQRAERERRVGAGGEHELDRRGQVLDEPRDALARGRARQPVEVVEHEHDVLLLQQRVDEPRPARPRAAARRPAAAASSSWASPGQARHSASTMCDHSTTGVVVAAVERHPRDRAVRELVLAPRRQQRRLAEPGRARHQAEAPPTALRRGARTGAPAPPSARGRTAGGAS
jgi:hypothetical protein